MNLEDGNSHSGPGPANAEGLALGAVAAAPRDPLSSCVHCGFCLEVCPTYRLTGDENNSPRGRLRLWREEADGRLAADPWIDHYTAECVGCLACESACPAGVPYGSILEDIRHRHVVEGRNVPDWRLRWADRLVRHPRWFGATMTPVRWLRRMGLLRHRNTFPGRPAMVQSTASYARRQMRRARPTGPTVALLTGCLVEAVFREINFATVRVLIENNVRVVVPTTQGCCGAFQQHSGIDGVEVLHEVNRRAFESLDVEAVLTHSAGCGLTLGKSLAGGPPVLDVIDYLDRRGPVPRQPAENAARLYVDLPCHLIHGQKVTRVPQRALDATGFPWQLAPMATECCGSGGVYHLHKPDNARAILAAKSAFLSDAVGDPVYLVTTNPVCVMHWNSARSSGAIRRPFEVKHLVQLLDPARH